MKGWENESYRLALLISNIVAWIILLAAIYRPFIARLLFFLLFGWACWMNWKTSQATPDVYLEYADMAMLDAYKDLILGWFSRHISLAVGFIATCQGLIAISMLMTGIPLKIGAIGAILFLLAIIPLGVGSGFPSTLVLAVAMFILLLKKLSPIFPRRMNSKMATTS